MKTRVQPIVNLPSPSSFFLRHPPPPPTAHTPCSALPRESGQLHAPRDQGGGCPARARMSPASRNVGSRRRSRTGRVGVPGQGGGRAGDRGPSDCQFRSGTELGPVAAGPAGSGEVGSGGEGDGGAERPRKPPPPNPGQRGQSQCRRRLGRGGACVPVSSASSPGRKPKRKTGVKVLLTASPETCLQ